MRDDAIFDMHYGYWFNLACERFYRNIDFTLNFVQLVGGSGAALGALSGRPVLVVASGLGLAACAALALLMQPGVKAEQNRVSKCQYLAIKERLLKLNDEELHAAVVQAQRDGPAGIGALAVPAFNATLDATGRANGRRPLRAIEWLATLVA